MTLRRPLAPEKVGAIKAATASKKLVITHKAVDEIVAVAVWVIRE